MNRHPKHLTTALVLAFGLAGCSDGAVTPMAPSTPGPTLATTSTSETSHDIVQLPGEEGQAIELNNTGVIVGVTTPDFHQQATYWTVDGSGTVDGPFVLGIPGDDIEAWAHGVNDAGHVIALERQSSRGFIYDIATDDLVELSAPEGAVGVTPRSINAGGVVTGNAVFEEGDSRDYRPAVWTDPFDTSLAPSLLPLPADHASNCSLPLPLTDEGLIVGYSLDEDGTCRLLRWTLMADGSVSEPEVWGPTDFFGRWTNEAGQIAGITGAGSSPQPVVLEPDGSLLQLEPAGDDPQAVAVGLNDPASGEPLLVAGTSDHWLDDERAVLWSVASDGTASAPSVLPIGDNGVASRGSSVNVDGWVVGRLTYTDPHPRRSGGRTAALWIPSADDGTTDDGGDDCVPKGPHGNNCK